MDTKELRIGNWVMRRDGTYTQIEEVLTSTILIKADPLYHYLKHITIPARSVSGIPLTPEVLDRAGFNRNGFGENEKSIPPFEGTYKMLTFSGDYLFLREGILKDRRDKDAICVLWNKDIKKNFYLHQLQNLYYAIEGVELNIAL